MSEELFSLMMKVAFSLIGGGILCLVAALIAFVWTGTGK